ncbi:MAG TPA: MCE family protein [Pseudonocardia sp.]|jgi:virulence factor Mce-like protein|nr:MCE family protein [Pseudonocardia sp.]
MADRLQTTPRRVLGLGMILIVVAIIGTCVASYNKAFTTRVPVTVRIDQVDNSFLPNAEVRMRGVNVGEVASTDVDGNTAVLNLELSPEQAKRIPRNVHAMILPKSLFGESFLSLETPEAPSRETIAAGDIIPRDRSTKAVQVEQLFTHLLPLIQAVKPADLAVTLNALNQALTGRGDQLGDTLRQLHQYLVKFNTTLPDLTADIRALPPLTDTYSTAAPDLIEGLKTLNTTSQTLVDRRDDLRDLFGDVKDAANGLEGFFDDYGDDVIDLSRDARPTLDLLARYSPEYVCLFDRLARAIPQGKKVFKEGSDRPALAVRVVVTITRGKYLPHQDEPDFTDNRGPACYSNAAPIQQYPGGEYQDGATHPPAVPAGSLTSSAPTTPADNERLHFYYDEDRDGHKHGHNDSPNSAQLPMLFSTGTGANASASTTGSPPILLRGAEVRPK